MSRAALRAAAVLVLASAPACIDFDAALAVGCLARPDLCPTDAGTNPGPTILVVLQDASPAFSLVGGVADPDGLIDVVVSWGDASTDTVITTNLGSITANHAYAAAGVYTVVVTALDALGATSSQSFTATVSLPAAGLLAHYRFSNDLTDSSGNGRTLTFGGMGSSASAGYTLDRADAGASAFRFHGNFVGDDYSYLVGTSVPTLDITQGFTISFWVKLSASGSQGHLLSQDDNWFIRFYTADRPMLSLANGAAVVEDDTSLPRNVWRHLAFVKTGSTVAIYVGGVQVHSQLIGAISNMCTSAGLIVNGWESNIGCANFPDTSFSDHAVDDLRLYSRNLSPAEVTLLANELP